MCIRDSPSAAGAIRTKAPKLYRLDLQFLIRRLALLAVKYKFYFWGIHCLKKNDPNMQIADEISRYAPCKLLDKPTTVRLRAIHVINDLLKELSVYPKNLNKKIELSTDRRRTYGLLLDKDHEFEPRDTLFEEQFKYNVLNNKLDI